MKLRYILTLMLTVFPVMSLMAQPEETFVISYLTAETVYLKGGKSDGLQVGDQLAVYRGGQRIGVIEVSFTASHSASCKILEKTGDFRTGDTVILLKSVPRSLPDASTVKQDTVRKRKRIFQPLRPSGASRKEAARVHGSAGIQLYYYNDTRASDLDFFQPTLRIKLRMDRLWGGHYRVNIETRTRHNQRARTYTNGTPKDKWRNRIYEFSLIYDNPERFLNFRAGRIISNYFSGIGYIDGFLLQQNYSTTLTSGFFVGTQPEWQYSDFQSSLQKYGAFMSWQPKEQAQSTLAFAGEYHGSTVSREFIYWQNRWQYGQKLYFFHSSEVDLNRSWKRDYHSAGIQLTSIYITGRWQISPIFNLGLTYDNRRNYLSYEWKGLPDSLFYEALRTGWHASAQIILPGNYRLNTNIGYRYQESGKNITRSYSVGLYKNRFFLKALSLYGRVSGFNNPFTRDSGLYGRLAYRFNNYLTFETAASALSYDYKSTQSARQTSWYQAGIRGYFGKRFYFYQSIQKNSGEDLAGLKTISELGIRF